MPTYTYKVGHVTYAVIGDTDSIIRWYVRTRWSSGFRGARLISKTAPSVRDNPNIIGCNANGALDRAAEFAVHLGDPMPDEYRKLLRGRKKRKELWDE